MMDNPNSYRIASRFQRSEESISRVTLGAIVGLGFLFLYAPLLILVLYSFNSSRLVTVWKGFSIKWYHELLMDEQILHALWVSLQVAVSSATIATLIGSMAAFALMRMGTFRGQGSLWTMITAPLIIPEVIIGISLLLLFVAMETVIGWPQGRGLLTITIAHATVSSAFVAIIIQSSLANETFELEEAAQDLGATPLSTVFLVTIPTHMPALVSGWLLAFTLSLDDLVIASFVSGPASSTLPMVIFSRVRLGVSPTINALTSVMLLVAALAVIIVLVLWQRRLQTKRPKFES